jgi:hypothetical protein
MRTSDFAASRFASSRPRGVPRSSVTDFLLRARLAHQSEVPSRTSRQPRIGSPPRGSILITSAPK